jgi:hypothetical protein
MTRERLAAGGVIVLLTLLGFFQFPGRTFLHSDSQIYVPILDHLSDPTLLAADLVATRPHVSYSIYDEMARFLRGATGASWEAVLVAQQLALRAAGIAGVYLIALALGVVPRMALLAAAIFSLGATISGPAVLTIEYEPVPRGFAVPLLLLAIGLLAHERHLAGGAAVGAAILYHPPTTAPVVAVYTLFAALARGDRARRLAALGPMAAAGALVFLLSRLQAGVGEPQVLFATIDPDWEKLQRMRASYNWISQWGSQWIQQYQLLAIAAWAAAWRLRVHASPPLRWLMFGLPLYGLAMLPLSNWLLESMKWSLIPQFQPARAVLFITVTALIGAAACAAHSLREGRWLAGTLWFTVAYAIPSHPEVVRVLLPDLRADLWRRKAIIVVAMASLAAIAAWAWARGRRWGLAPWAAALAAPFFLIPGYGKVVNYPSLMTPEIESVSRWARETTPKDAVFLFPDAGRALDPGIFRALAARTVYVDWKAGGQVNLLKKFGDEWWRRWQATMEHKFDPANTARYAGLGISYLVVRPENRIPSLQPALENARYAVYRLKP